MKGQKSLVNEEKIREQLAILRQKITCMDKEIISQINNFMQKRLKLVSKVVHSKVELGDLLISDPLEDLKIEEIKKYAEEIGFFDPVLAQFIMRLTILYTIKYELILLQEIQKQ